MKNYLKSDNEMIPNKNQADSTINTQKSRASIKLGST